MLELERAVTALTALGDPSVRVSRTGPELVAFEVLSVRTRRGQLVTPLAFELEVEIQVRLDDLNYHYYFSGTSHERTGLSSRTETFTGVYRRRERGSYVTFDGIVPVEFDTGAVFDRIEAALALLGWSRG